MQRAGKTGVTLVGFLLKRRGVSHCTAAQYALFIFLKTPTNIADGTGGGGQDMEVSKWSERHWERVGKSQNRKQIFPIGCKRIL